MGLFNVITVLCIVAVVHLSNGLRIDRGRSGDKIFVNTTTCRQCNAAPKPDGLESCLCSTNPAAVFESRQEETYQCMNFSHIQHGMYLSKRFSLAKFKYKCMCRSLFLIKLQACSLQLY